MYKIKFQIRPVALTVTRFKPGHIFTRLVFSFPFALIVSLFTEGTELYKRHNFRPLPFLSQKQHQNFTNRPIHNFYCENKYIKMRYCLLFDLNTV